MRRIVLLFLFLALLAQPVFAAELKAPEVPDAGAKLMPENRETFLDGLLELLRRVLPMIRPDLAEALKICGGIFCAVLLLSIVQTASGSVKTVSELAGVVCISAMVLNSTDSLIRLAADTIQELTEYEKLLLPVLTSAMAAQGGVSTATALYTGTALFNTVLGKIFCTFLLPLIYLYLALAIASGTFEEPILDKTKEAFKKTVFWTIKTLLTVFTGFLGMTGVISGATDAAALKATKATISIVVPVVGKIMSDASEAVLIGAALAKNAMGIYGIYAILAVFLGPFVRIGVHYLLFKLTALICFIFGSKRVTGLIEDISAAMSILLAATGAMCFLLLISCICFLKGVR